MSTNNKAKEVSNVVEIKKEVTTHQVEENSVEESSNEPTMIDELFEGGSSTTSNRGNQLSATAELTKVASDFARELLISIHGDADSKKLVEISTDSHTGMDDVINRFINIPEVDKTFLDSTKTSELEKMIRSQQSKRSRTKSKGVKTKDEWLTLATAGIAELILRDKLEKPKTYGGYRSDVELDEEEIQKLLSNKGDLNKAIRNVQSKKSIMKAKDDFKETDEKYLQLLELEQSLKELRDQQNAIVPVEVQKDLVAKKQAEELLQELDPDTISEEDAKKQLAKLKDILATVDSESEQVTE